ncbi:MAG: DUF2721 domain-containing protein [Candidatus Auribacterota bacterium]|nr:DUF2721 domain-containing protein [Candidatus Auribacterota bacterium]
MTLTTPALLFPAISLLMLSYNSRFLVLAQLVRELHSRRNSATLTTIMPQIQNLSKRISIIKGMQICGVLSFIGCATSMFALFLRHVILGEVLFGISLLFLLASLILSLIELSISTDALRVQLSDMSSLDI